MYYPVNYTLVSGFGNDKTQLVSFDKALFFAGVANYNLVKVSSILPPNCENLSIITAKPGSIIYSAYATLSSNTSGKISSAVGVGIPKRSSDIGVIMEFSCNDKAEISKHNVEEMVKEAMSLREIGIHEIKTTSIEADVANDIYTTVISAIMMW